VETGGVESVGCVERCACSAKRLGAWGGGWMRCGGAKGGGVGYGDADADADAIEGERGRL
jgi:hypothetical protein